MHDYDYLVNELGDLTPEARVFASEFFGTLLVNLHCEDVPRSALSDPGPLSARDRIMSFLEQMTPGLFGSELGPEVERAVNALLVHVHESVPSGGSLGTVKP